MIRRGCVALILLHACSPGGRSGERPSGADSPATPATQAAPPPEPARAAAGIEGVIGSIGVEPMVTLVIRPAGGDPIQVTGGLRAELGRLTGATVFLLGDVRPQTPWPVIEPSGYRVVAIDGQKPYVGTLRVEGTAVLLESDSVLQLFDVPERLRQQNGAKVYVLGQPKEGGIAVSSFGVIVPP